jgi:hypothetical protein
MDKPAKPKDTFYLFRRKRKEQEGYEYIQHIVSPSHDNGLSTSCCPEYAWRGNTLLDIKKMKYLISINPFYKDSDWELVKYEMEIETPSWSHQPERKEYECLHIGKWRKLSNDECVELEEYKQFAIKKYGSKG